MRTKLLPVALVVAVPVILSSRSVAAQQPVTKEPARPAGGMAMNDPTHQVAGTGQLPTGWSLRFDPSRPGRPAPQPTDVSFVTMGPGYHVKSGPAAIYYRTGDSVSGQYTVTASFSQAKSMAHEAYGVFVGGANLQDSTQRYLYFVIRPMDGGILINKRTSDARPTAIVPWTPDPAVNKEDATDGHATNKLAIHVGRDSVQFIANDKVVRTLAKADLGVPTDGIAGLRINHNLDVHIGQFTITRGQ